MNKFILWWKSIWSTVKPPKQQIQSGDDETIPSIKGADINIVSGGINNLGIKEAKVLTDNNGDIELK